MSTDEGVEMAETAAETPVNDENTEATETAATAKKRHDVPDGIVTPIALKNHLVKEGLAPKDTKPQQFYAFVKSPGKNDPFPVKHYDAEGNEYGEAQTHPETGETTTRPGLLLDEGVAWWKRRLERVANKSTAGAQATAATTPAEAANPSVPAPVVNDADQTADEAELGEYEEAE
jgi:hypothetical protein